MLKSLYKSYNLMTAQSGAGTAGCVLRVTVVGLGSHAAVDIGLLYQIRLMTVRTFNRAAESECKRGRSGVRLVTRVCE
jgi:hypothetical protein